MHELARQHYLDAMGIQTYMPKLVLPMAPVPRQCDLSGLVADAAAPGAITRPSTSVDRASTATEAAQMPQSVDALLASMGAPPAKAGVAKKTAKPAPAALDQPAAPSFAVSLWQCGGLIVIADRHTELALPVNVLLKNILVALGRGRDVADSPEVIRWPLDGVPAAQAGPARTYFSSLLLARRLPSEPTTVLCFGEVIRAQLTPATVATFEATELQLSEQDRMPMIALPSLEAILGDCQLKAPVWAAVATLRQQ